MCLSVCVSVCMCVCVSACVYVCVHLIGSHFQTLLQSHQLFTCKTPEEISRLVKEGAKVDVQRGDKATPLMVHAENGNKEVVQQLISYDANVDTQDEVRLSVCHLNLSVLCLYVCVSVT